MIASGGSAGAGVAISHPLPEGGIDLRAELAAHQRERVEQALARAGGDLSLAARLLRVTPLELARLHAGDDALAPVAAPVTRAERRRASETPRLPDDLPRVAGGVELISTAVILRLDQEGRSARSIATYLGVNPFTVEKVLRMAKERAVRRLHGEGMRPSQIALKLGVNRAFVARALEAPLAKCGAARPAPSDAQQPPPPQQQTESRDRWRGV